MNQTSDSGAAAGSLRILGEQTIHNVSAFQQALAGVLASGQPVVVDLSAVEVCDAAALQVLFAARESAVRRQQPLEFAGFSPAVAETASALGLSLEHLDRGI